MVLDRIVLPVDPFSLRGVADAVGMAPSGAVDSFDGDCVINAFGHFFDPFLSLSCREVSPHHYGFHSCAWVGPHTDSTIGDVTIGLVLCGNHYLFVEDGHKVGDLLPGTLFALNNKTLHGAFCREGHSEEQAAPLVFTTVDLVCEWEAAAAFLKSLKSASSIAA
jgi:hypothetical protein